jgi:hypothetical protein
MLPKFTNSILLLTSLIDCLTASPTRHLLSSPSQPTSSSYTSAFLEKRGRPASSSSSCSSVDSDSTNPPEAPVLKTASIDEGNQGQKRKRVRSDEQRLKRNNARRNAYARTREVLKGDPAVMAIAKEKIRVKNSIAYGKSGPAAKAATKLKRDGKKKERKRLKDEKEAKGEALDAANPDANPLYAIERRLRNAVSNLRKKGTDPPTLAEIEKKKKKLMEVRQRLKAEKEVNREALYAADTDAIPLYAIERRLRSAVCNLRKKETDPTTLAELEKKLVEVRQRLRSEKVAKREAMDAADPDKPKVKNRKYCREYFAERKKMKASAEKNAVANIMMRVRDINYIPLIGENDQEEGDNDNETIEDTDEGGVETIEDKVKIEGCEEEEIEEIDKIRR